MDIVTSIIAIAALLVLYAFIKRRGSGNDVRPVARRASSAVSSTKFHAVSLKFASSACEAARNMDGKRFLSTAAPRIPLPECDAPECKCRFLHHKDRRAGDDRRNLYAHGYSSGSTGKHEVEQRKGRERRDDDPEDFFS
jgi:hypothetical protein